MKPSRDTDIIKMIFLISVPPKSPGRRENLVLRPSWVVLSLAGVSRSGQVSDRVRGQ
jgi:hypothetical protein